MKPSLLLLAVSLVVNAALVVVVCRRPETAASLPLFRHNSDASKNATRPAAEAGARDAELARALVSNNPTALRDQLRALGLSERTVRSLVRALLWQPYYERYGSLLASHRSDKPELLRGDGYSTGFTREERAGLRALTHDINQQIFSVLGSNSIEPDLDTLRYSYLPPDKADQLRLINRDYAEMRSDLNQEIGRFRVPSDDDKLKLLEEEHRKDIEAELTPGELVDYDLRHSKTASMLRNRLANLNVTDDEFRSLYDALKPTESTYTTMSDLGIKPGVALTKEQMATIQAQRTAREQADEKVKSLLGDERYAEYQRATDSDYRNLQAAANRFDLSKQSIEQVYALRATVSAETKRIANDASLEADQKRASLSDLAAQARSQVKSTLGEEIGSAYLNTSMRWLDRVANGFTVTFSPTGNSTSFKPVAPKTPPTPAKVTARPPAS